MHTPDRPFRETVTEYIRTAPHLRSLGVYSHEQHMDSGSGSTVYQVNVFPYGLSALKVYDLTGSEGLSIYGVDQFKTQTNELSHEVRAWREDLRTRTYTPVHSQPISFSWKVNPINKTGLVRLEPNWSGKKRTVPYALSLWVEGVSLADIFHSNETFSKKEQSGVLFDEDVRHFLRQEFERFSRIVHMEHAYGSLVKLIALNVLVSAQSLPSHYDL